MKPKDETKPYESRLLIDLHPTLAHAYKKAEAQFNATHNDVHVIIVLSPAGSQSTKLLALLAYPGKFSESQVAGC